MFDQATVLTMAVKQYSGWIRVCVDGYTNTDTDTDTQRQGAEIHRYTDAGLHSTKRNHMTI